MTRRRTIDRRNRALAVGLAGSAAAQGYPDRIIELVVPVHAGLVGRHPGPRAGRRHGARSSASASSCSTSPARGGILGTAEVARAKPDGYTLLHGAVFSLTVQPLTERQTGYTAAIVRADLPDLQERPGDRGAARHLQEPRRHHGREQGQARRPELRQPGPRHHPASVDGRAVADQQGRSSTTCRSGDRPRSIQMTHRRARSISRWRR